MVVTCPQCGVDRELKRQAEWRLKTGRSDGSCLSCSQKGNTHGVGRYRVNTELGRTLLFGRMYWIWVGVRSRCNSPTNVRYSRYGGRGIRVCERWDSFDNFAADMAGSYADDLTIERIDNDGDYEPSNCRWATAHEQALNKSTSHLLTYRGRTQNLSTWAQEKGMTFNALRGRLDLGWSVEKALETPMRERVVRKGLTYKGETLSTKEWGRRLGIKPHTISSRLNKGWSIERALSEG